MRALELKIPPPVVALLVALAMWGVSRDAAALPAAEFARLPLALALAVVGAAFDVSGLIAFRRARTTINPMKPQATSSIVDSGVYRLTRNPMYVGLTGLYLGVTVLIDSLWPLLLLPMVLVALYFFVIRREERYLAARFGADYEDYRRRVRRWF